MAGFPAHKNWYTSSVKHAAVTTWATGVAKAAGALVKQSGTPTVGNERVYVAHNAGTTGGGADPLTTFTRGVKITDNDIVWQEVTGIPALNGDLTDTPNWVASRAAGTTPSLGHVVKDAAGTHIFIVSVAGTVGAVEPSWNVAAVGNTTTDNGVTWVYLGTSFAAWAAPHARVANALTTNWGDTGQNQASNTKFWLGSDHNETTAANVTWTARGSNLLPIDIACVNVAGSTPPVAGDERTTAAVSVTGQNSITVNGAFRVCSGIVFTIGTSNNMTMNFAGDALHKLYKDCTFAFGTGAGSGSQMSSSDNANACVEFENCIIKFTNAGHNWQPQGRVRWNQGSLDSGTVPTTFVSTASRTVLDIRNVDLSALSTKTFMTSNQSNIFDVTLRDCKIPASWTVLTPANVVSQEQRFRMSRCDSGGNTYRAEAYEWAGAMTTETTVIRTGGANNDVVGFSWKFTTSVNATLGAALHSLAFAKSNATIGNVVVTVYGIINAAAVPNDNDIFMNVEYPGDSASAQSSVKTSRPSFLSTGTPLTADSASAWDSVATARANTHAYAVGDIIKLASNPGRLFFCTTLGTSSGSEPVGYASAIDGGSVTDGSAVFRAACRFKLTVTLTSPQPQLAGLIYATIRAAKLSTVYYVDPFINLS